MRLPAGTTLCGAGWQSVGRLWRAVRGGLVPAGKIAHRISSPAPSATFCSLAGLRVVLEILLAAQRARENGELEQYVGPRVMEGLIMAGLGLAAHASTRVRPDG